MYCVLKEGTKFSVSLSVMIAVDYHCYCKKTGCWFVGGDNLTGALHDLI